MAEDEEEYVDEVAATEEGATEGAEGGEAATEAAAGGEDAATEEVDEVRMLPPAGAHSAHPIYATSKQNYPAGFDTTGWSSPVQCRAVWPLASRAISSYS